MIDGTFEIFPKMDSSFDTFKHGTQDAMFDINMACPFPNDIDGIIKQLRMITGNTCTDAYIAGYLSVVFNKQ